MTTRCGNRKYHGINPAHHESATRVRECFAFGGVASLEEADEDAAFQAAARAELAYERYLETDHVYAYEVEQDELRADWGMPF